MNILIKFSGEFFTARDEMKPEGLEFLKQLKENNYNHGYIVIGGGNRCRGKNSEHERNISDSIGTLSTLMNGLILKSYMQKFGLNSEIFTHYNGLFNYYSPQSATNSYKNGNWVILTTGLGNVGFISTDLSAVIKALELKVDALIKVTKVAGVYDKDPAITGAKLLEKISYEDILKNKLNVLDLSALEIAHENSLSIGVCNITNFNKFLKKEAPGSVIGKDYR